MAGKRTSKSVDKLSELTANMTAADLEAIDELVRRRSRRKSAPDMKMDFDEATRVLNIRFDHESEAAGQAMMMVQLGICDVRVFLGLLNQVAALGKSGKVISEEATNFAFGVIASIEPRDEVEAMLGAQMAATHQATMMMARRLNHVENIPQHDAAERAFNKLARTYSTQMDALKRYRAKAQQTVRVERVTINEGGQAIVGHVETGGRGGHEK